MPEFNILLEKNIKKVNKLISSKYRNAINIDKEELRKLLEDEIGDIVELKKLSKKELDNIKEKGGILGVDGSVNKKGGAFPHYIEIYQALAKSTVKNDYTSRLIDIYTPFLEGEEKDRNKILADIEVRVSLEAIKKHKPYIILMDGGLIRFNIEANKNWSILKRKCIENNIIIVGIIKDIKTSIIGNSLSNMNSNFSKDFYDREILYGKLNYGEGLLVRENVNTKDKDGYRSIFLRSSKSPNLIGIDILEEQKSYLEYIARLVLSLTPLNSRGVPLWLDIVDEEVKLSDNMIEEVLENNLDRDIYNRFFVSERDLRN